MGKRRGLTTKFIVIVLIIIIILSILAAAYFFRAKPPEEQQPEERPPEEKPPQEKPPEEQAPQEQPPEEQPKEKPPEERTENLTLLTMPTLSPEVREDVDEDGLSNSEELRVGTDPLDPDTDGDGILDGLEEEKDYDGDGLINALDKDSDGDGLLDGQEDLNLNGVRDEGETDPLDPDTDGDGLLDGQERDTDPLNPDTDMDGLQDGVEPNWYEDYDEDGLINALDPDSDDDGLLDGQENELGTGILNPDTDGDGLLDGLEYGKGLDPLSRDTDMDGLQDGQEAYDDVWIEAEDVAVHEEQVIFDPEASNNHTVTSAPAGVVCSAKLTLEPGEYRVWVRAKAESGEFPTLKVQVYSKGERLLAEDHVLPYIEVNGTSVNIYRWYSTSSFGLPDGGNVELIITSPPSDVILLDRIMVQKVEGWEVQPTDPLDPDTDGDGLLDGQELIRPSFWFEAEHYSSGQLWASGEFSDGYAVAPSIHDGLMDYVVLEGRLERGWYSMFVRASSQQLASLNVRIHLKEEVLDGACEVFPQYPRGRWSAVYFDGDLSKACFWVEEETPVEIWIWANATAVALVDRIAIFKAEFYRPWDQIFSQDARPLPRGLDPLDPDTDGDEYRTVEGALKGSIGYLTDGFEWRLGLNPFDLDTDNDGLFWENFTIPCTDDKDPSPMTWDYDRDGLFDWIEDSNGNGIFEPQFGETDAWDADTDDDGIIDGNEDPNYQGYDVYETDPLMPDTDHDGLLDGVEVGLKEPQRPEATEGWKGGGGRVTDPTDWDTDDDGLPDGWIDFNEDGNLTLGEFEDFNLNGFTDAGKWMEGGETDPLSPDTDMDGLDDRYEVVNGLDPLEIQPFDLSLEGLTLSPQPAILGPSEDEASLSITASVRNLGPGRLPLNSRSGPLFITLNLTILKEGEPVKEVKRTGRAELDAGQGAQVRFGTIALGPGKYQVIAELGVGKGPLVELNEDNNRFGSTIEVLSPPKAWAEVAGVEEIRNGFNVTLSFGAEDPDSKELEYSWDFDGDGNADWSIKASPGLKLAVWTNITGTGNHYPVLKVVDEDGLQDDVRLGFGLWHLWKGDYDGDGLNSTEEAELGTDPENPDTDGDGLLDGQEVKVGSDPLVKDSDYDRIEDGLEYSFMVAMGLDPLSRPDADGDGLINILDPDSDNDGVPDGREVIYLGERADDIESWSGTNPYVNDTDMDGLLDGQERDTDPLNPDTDGDGLDDRREVLYGTDPLDPDTDDDGIIDPIDLQPLSGPIEKKFGMYKLFGTLWEPGLVRFDAPVRVYWVKGTAYRNDGAGWYEISSKNVKSRKAEPGDVMKFDWGDYRVLSVREREGMAISKVEGDVDTFPPYYKVKYEVEMDEFEVTFINKDWVACGGFSSAIVWSSVDAGNESVLLQFRVPKDRYYKGDEILTTAGFLYRVYDDPSFEEKGAVASILVPAVRLDEGVYQAELPLPSGYEHLALFLSPVWIDQIGEEVKLRPISGDGMVIGALAKLVYMDGKRVMYGLTSFDALLDPMPKGLREEGSYERKIIEEFGLVEYSGEEFIFRRIRSFEGVKVEEGALHRMAYEEVVEEKRFPTFEELKRGLEEMDFEDVEGALSDAGDLLQVAREMAKEEGISVKDLGLFLATMISDKGVTTGLSAKGGIWAKMARIYEPMKKAYEEVEELRIAYGRFKAVLQKVPKGVKAPGLKFMRNVIRNRLASLRNPLKTRSFYITVAIGMVEIAANLYMASKAPTTFEKSYYLAQATLAGIFLAVAVALYFIPGGQVIGLIITVLLLIPQVREKLDEFSDWLSAGWEELLGEVPTKFALEMFKKGCNLLKQEAEKAVNRGYLAIAVYPSWS